MEKAKPPVLETRVLFGLAVHGLTHYVPQPFLRLQVAVSSAGRI